MNSRVILLACVALFVSLSSTTVVSYAGTLTIEERIEAQRAIEEVYWRHRTWPEANRAPKPPLSGVMTDATLRSRVEDYLRKSNALAAVWGRPITSKQLQAEMERMAGKTKAPDVLRELFVALGNDPALIAETLVRQKLVERLMRSAYDDSAPADATCLPDLDAWWTTKGTEYGTTLDEALGAYSAVRIVGSGCVDDTWRKTFDADIPDAMAEHTAVWTGTEMIVWGGYDGSVTSRDTGGRYDPSTDTWVPTSTGAGVPQARYGHTAVWTGTRMVVWGGSDDTFAVLNSGGRYDPSTDTWETTSMGASVPDARYLHTAVWTGTEMIVWGGEHGDYFNTGGRYNPSTDTWSATSTGAGVPAQRSRHSAVWTGAQMIVWGGVDNVSAGYANTGGRYDPSTNTWAATSTGAGVPLGRYGPSAIWTGTEMIVWGGNGESPYPENSGGRYDPTTDTWVATSTGAGVPSGRDLHTAVWTGTEMIVWGGADYITSYANAGGRYDPATDTWTAVAIDPSSEWNRAYHTAVWTGTEMIVWGGWGGGGVAVLNSGSRYDPGADTWAETSGRPNDPPVARFRHTSVWTGTELIVWGGSDGSGYLDTGGRYEPSTDTWTATSTGAGTPEPRNSHTAVWTGTEMIVWGGFDDSGVLDTGGRYDPSTDTWVATSMGIAAPAGRYEHTSVWSGAEMIVWGGINYTLLNTGSRYNPATDTWAATSTGAGVPSTRSLHTAVWTGTEMIVWGGQTGSPPLNSGSRYDPTTDTWTSMSLIAAPSTRHEHVVVWTGTEMIVWGGWYLASDLNTGGRYDPFLDAWSATSTGAEVPARRHQSTAVWTGTEMIVWGGVDYDTGTLDTGGRYDPVTNTWVATSTGADVPSKRTRHSAVWTGNEMIVWSGVPITSTGGLYCAAARCNGSSEVCDDGNACTSDSCDISTGLCMNTSEPEGTPCDDGNACTGSGGSPDSCDGAGTCVGGAPPDADDGNACTLDYCDPKSGAVNEPIECNDGNVCNGTETCDPATGCVAGTPPGCDDFNVCSGVETCNPATGCVSGTPPVCDDGNACNGLETCNPPGGCVSGTPVVCAPPGECHTAGVCNPGTGTCSYGTQPNGTACTGGTCQNGVCTPDTGCTSTHNPRTVGFWRKVCRRGTFRGETISDADAACVNALSDTFDTTTRAQVCNVLDGDHDHHDDYRRHSCSKAEDQLMALALNLCKERVCCDDGIDSRCDNDGHEDDLSFNHNNHGDDDDDDGHHDGDDDDDDDPGGEGSTVCASFNTADALLDDPERASSECRRAECLSKEINNGHSLEFATLVVRREGSQVRLAWLSPVLNDGTSRPESYKIWRREARSEAPFVHIGSTMGTEYVDAAGNAASWEYDVTAVLPDDEGDE